IADMPIRVETRTKKMAGHDDRVIERSVKFPIWFDPLNRGKTSMCAGLNTALEVLRAWCSKHVNSYPPTVLHVTDGHPTDGNPEPIADQITNLGTEDGTCLLFNLHVDIGSGSPLIFPNDTRLIPDRYGQTLFRMSSTLPRHAIEAVKSKGHDVRTGARG